MIIGCEGSGGWDVLFALAVLLPIVLPAIVFMLIMWKDD